MPQTHTPMNSIACGGNIPRRMGRSARSTWSLIGLLLILAPFLHGPAPARAQAAPARPEHSSNPPGAGDGQHDFDFEIGSWKTDLKVLQHPLTGSTTWIEYHGTSVVHKIWNGRANMVELSVDGPAGHLEGLSLRLYNPDSHQWSLNFANSKVGTIGVPTVGAFKNGRGEFYDMEPVNGKMLLVRNVWSDISADSCHFEQAFSVDGGKSWETNWIATDTRIKSAGAENWR
jgi:hypothetical protein